MNNSRTNNSLSENISKSFLQETQPLDIIKGFQDSSAILEKLEENLEKGLISDVEFEKALSTLNLLDPELDLIEKGGEGSRGGKVIGRTKSGKPIYDTASHESHSNFTKTDHEDAADIHRRLGGEMYRDITDKQIIRFRHNKEQRMLHENEVKRKGEEKDHEHKHNLKQGDSVKRSGSSESLKKIREINGNLVHLEGESDPTHIDKLYHPTGKKVIS